MIPKATKVKTNWWGKLLCKLGKHQYVLLPVLIEEDTNVVYWIFSEYDYYNVCERQGCSAHKGAGERYR